MNGNILTHILLIRISRGANNCAQRVFEKNLRLNDISPHFKFLLSKERLDFCEFYKKKKRSKGLTMQINFHSCL